MNNIDLLSKLLRLKNNLSFKNKLQIFVLSCINKNRFFPIKDSQVLLQELLKYGSEKSLDQGTKCYRAKIHDDLDNYYKKEPLDYEYALPPQAPNNPGGRFNPPGFSYLYVSNNEKTAIFEVKPHRFSYITIFEGVFKKSIKIIDFSDFVPELNLAFVNANSTLREENELKQFICFLISLPVEPRLSNMLYPPTQLIADFIKSKGYDGICVMSSLNGGGKNYVIFTGDVVNFEKGNRRVVLIKSMSYEYDEIP